MKYTVPLYIIAISLVTISLQSAGIIPPFKTYKVPVDIIDSVTITGGSTLDLDIFSKPIEVKIKNISEISR